MTLLERLLAVLLGIIVLPLCVLAYTVLYAMLLLLIGVGSVIGLPLMVAASLNYVGIPKVMNILLTSLIIFPLIVVLTTIAGAALTAYLIYNAVVELFASAWIGFKTGLMNGIDGFWHALTTQQTFSQNTFEWLRMFMNDASREELNDDVDFDGFQRVVDELRDVVVVHEDLEVPDMEHSAPKVLAVLLSEFELEQIGKLIGRFAELRKPLSLEEKKQFETLKILYAQYHDLSQKLEEVRLALVRGDKSKIKDELIAFNDVEKPILLVKQYKNEEQWFNVPAASYVTDKDSLLTWLKQNPKHPLNKDLLKKPEHYNKMETRYIWYELTENDCSSQELGEAAAQMRIIVNALSEGQKINLGVGSGRQSIFCRKSTVFSDASQVDQENLSTLKSSL